MAGKRAGSAPEFAALSPALPVRKSMTAWTKAKVQVAGVGNGKKRGRTPKIASRLNRRTNHDSGAIDSCRLWPEFPTWDRSQGGPHLQPRGLRHRSLARVALDDGRRVSGRRGIAGNEGKNRRVAFRVLLQHNRGHTTPYSATCRGAVPTSIGASSHQAAHQFPIVPRWKYTISLNF